MRFHAPFVHTSERDHGSILEEAISVGVPRFLKSVYLPGNPEVKRIAKYSAEASAPSPHGLVVEFVSGETYIITIQRKKEG